MSKIAKKADYRAGLVSREEKIAYDLEHEKDCTIRDQFKVDYSHNGLVMGTYGDTHRGEEFCLWLGDGYKVSKNRKFITPLLYSPAALSIVVFSGFFIWIFQTFKGTYPGDPYFGVSLVGGLLSLIVTAIFVGALFAGSDCEWTNWSSLGIKAKIVRPPENSIQILESAHVRFKKLLETNKNKNTINSLAKNKAEMVEAPEELSAWLMMVVEIFDIMPDFPTDSILMGNVNMYEILKSLEIRDAEIAREKAEAAALDEKAEKFGKNKLKELTSEAEEASKASTIAFIEGLSPEML